MSRCYPASPCRVSLAPAPGPACGLPHPRCQVGSEPRALAVPGLCSTVLASEVAAHVRKCPAAKLRAAAEAQEYVRRGLNASDTAVPHPSPEAPAGAPLGGAGAGPAEPQGGARAGAGGESGVGQVRERARQAVRDRLLGLGQEEWQQLRGRLQRALDDPHVRDCASAAPSVLWPPECQAWVADVERLRYATPKAPHGCSLELSCHPSWSCGAVSLCPKKQGRGSRT